MPPVNEGGRMRVGFSPDIELCDRYERAMLSFVSHGILYSNMLFQRVHSMEILLS
jgi:hypothetical protein